MDRRGFFGRFAAAAAAFTALANGRGATASLPAKPKAIAKTTPQVAITANTTKFEQAIGAAGREVVEMLKQCRVVTYETSMSAGMLPEVRAVFKKAPKNAPRTDMDEKAWQLIERGALRSVQVTQASEDFDLHLGAGFGRVPLHRPQYEIEATWIVVNP